VQDGALGAVPDASAPGAEDAPAVAGEDLDLNDLTLNLKNKKKKKKAKVGSVRQPWIF
jgi:hypothetical protein